MQLVNREKNIVIHSHNPPVQNSQVIQYLKDLTKEHEAILRDQRQRLAEDNDLREAIRYRREGYLQELGALQQKWRTDDILLQENQLLQQISNLETRRQEILGNIQRVQDQNGLQVLEANREPRQRMNPLGLSYAQQVPQVHNADQFTATEQRKRPITAPDEMRGPSSRQKRLDAGKPEISDLRPGEIYEIRRGDGKFYPGILLPLAGLEEIGICGSLATLFQYASGPVCYRYAGDQIVGWRDGYEDGGPLVTQRRYPVLLLDEGDFPVPPPEVRFELPKQSVYDWSAAHDFRTLPPSKVASMSCRFKRPITLFRERLQAMTTEGSQGRVADRTTSSRLDDDRALPPTLKDSPVAMTPSSTILT